MLNMLLIKRAKVYLKFHGLHEDRVVVVLDNLGLEFLVSAWQKIHLDISIWLPSSKVSSFQVLNKKRG